MFLVSSIWTAKNPPEPCLFMSTAIALSLDGRDVHSFPVLGSKNNFSVLVMFSIFDIGSVQFAHAVRCPVCPRALTSNADFLSFDF